MQLRFVKIAVVYLVLGAALGLAMGISGTFVLSSVHTHLLLLGWTSLALAGLVYHWYPKASATRLARAHFWMHNAGLPVFMLGLALLLTGRAWAEVLTAGAGAVVALGLVVFAVNVLFNVKEPA
jgi:cbb3-type cytochrome oxidase subunit 1